MATNESPLAPRPFLVWRNTENPPQLPERRRRMFTVSNEPKFMMMGNNIRQRFEERFPQGQPPQPIKPSEIPGEVQKAVQWVESRMPSEFPEGASEITTNVLNYLRQRVSQGAPVTKEDITKAVQWAKSNLPERRYDVNPMPGEGG